MDEGGTVRWTDGTLRWTAPPTLREGEPVLKIGRERVPSPRGKSAPGRVRGPRPRPRRCTRPAPISKTTTEAMRKTTGCHRTRTATFRVAARYLADPVTSSRLRPPSNAVCTNYGERFENGAFGTLSRRSRSLTRSPVNGRRLEARPSVREIEGF
jgi:hypothetical protein